MDLYTQRVLSPSHLNKLLLSLSLSFRIFSIDFSPTRASHTFNYTLTKWESITHGRTTITGHTSRLPSIQIAFGSVIRKYCTQKKRETAAQSTYGWNFLHAVDTLFEPIFCAFVWTHVVKSAIMRNPRAISNVSVVETCRSQSIIVAHIRLLNTHLAQTSC